MSTTLSGNGGSISDSALSMKVAAATGFAVPSSSQAPYLVLVDSEKILVTAFNVGTLTMTIVRAQAGTSAASHNDGATVALTEPPYQVLAASIGPDRLAASVVENIRRT